MEPLLSAIMNDLVGRALSMLIQGYMRPKAEETEHKLLRLQRVLLRIDATVEEADGRHITNQAMLRQLGMLRQAMYGGHYMLDTFKYRGHEHGGDEEEVSGIVLSRFSSAMRLLSFPIRNSSSKENLEKMLDGLEMLIGDMVEFAVFLRGYPRLCRQPYSEYLVLDKVMFGRPMEKETVINFLLRPEAAAGDGNPGVLPIIGEARNILLDERVRGHFSSIIFFDGDDLGAENMATLPQNGVIKHQDLTTSSCGRLLLVIELAGDMEEEAWINLYCTAARSIGHGGKIIITSRSEKIAALGTERALRLKLLHEEAYWYFFKILAFGSANPEDHPKLASLGMEIAALFWGANIVGSIMRADLNVQYWRRVLHGLRKFTSQHLLTHGKHPTDLVEKGRPLYWWSMARSQNVMIYKVDQKGPYQCTTQKEQVLPKLTARDVIEGRASATHQGKFKAVHWRKKRPRQATF
ncbi:hypothetical protein HU200_037162 [Digitaria exilis]|uniref:Disease resistance N-terminal domain-containing protein n=1 Tax=Digitaria exilis TaxID=1010633 RepID=A0A835BCR2_9POAL|nr:hypothetical protein HU200_037162 [Digitaria exilis]